MNIKDRPEEMDGRGKMAFSSSIILYPDRHATEIPLNQHHTEGNASSVSSCSIWCRKAMHHIKPPILISVLLPGTYIHLCSCTGNIISVGDHPTVAE